MRGYALALEIHLLQIMLVQLLQQPEPHFQRLVLPRQELQLVVPRLQPSYELLQRELL